MSGSMGKCWKNRRLKVKESDDHVGYMLFREKGQRIVKKMKVEKFTNLKQSHIGVCSWNAYSSDFHKTIVWMNKYSHDLHGYQSLGSQRNPAQGGQCDPTAALCFHEPTFWVGSDTE